MNKTRGPAAEFLTPILDTYRGSAIGIVGCHARGLERRSCELDVLIVANEKRPNSTVRMGEVFLDLMFVTEKEVLRPTNPEHAVSMAQANTVRDTSLVLSTGFASSLALLAISARRSSTRRLASALKSLGRVEDALSKGILVDADYWLLSAAYDCSYSWLYSREVIPSPSHLLGQLRVQSKGHIMSFESFSRGAGLENSSRENCASRLASIAVLHDILGGGHEGRKALRSTWSPSHLESVSSKARELNESIEHAECYAYLGVEMLNAIKQLSTRERGTSTTAVGPSLLTSGTNKVMGDRMLKDMGLTRERKPLKESLELLRSQVSKLAREV